jgi:hypothetical protein
VASAVLRGPVVTGAGWRGRAAACILPCFLAYHLWMWVGKGLCRGTWCEGVKRYVWCVARVCCERIHFLLRA